MGSKSLWGTGRCHAEFETLDSTQTQLSTAVAWKNYQVGSDCWLRLGRTMYSRGSLLADVKWLSREGQASASQVRRSVQQGTDYWEMRDQNCRKRILEDTLRVYACPAQGKSCLEGMARIVHYERIPGTFPVSIAKSCGLLPNHRRPYQAGTGWQHCPSSSDPSGTLQTQP